MNIEKFYYDEQTEMYEQMKKEQDEHEQSLSVEEREKEHQKLFQEARTIMEKAERKNIRDLYICQNGQYSFQKSQDVILRFRLFQTCLHLLKCRRDISGC